MFEFFVKSVKKFEFKIATDSNQYMRDRGFSNGALARFNLNLTLPYKLYYSTDITKHLNTHSMSLTLTQTHEVILTIYIHIINDKGPG